MSLELPKISGGFREYSNVFYLVPSLGQATDEGCVALSTLVSPEQASVLIVTGIASPDDRLAVWRDNVDGELPKRLVFVDIGGNNRSISTASPTQLGPDEKPIPIETVSDPTNLTKLGVILTNYLGEWKADSEEIVVCFRPVTTLLQYADVKQVFRFLHELTRRSKAVDAMAHYHIDPTAHETQTINRLKTLFDASLEVDNDGEWVVRTR